jgi:hypothetical protein
MRGQHERFVGVEQKMRAQMTCVRVIERREHQPGRTLHEDRADHRIAEVVDERTPGPVVPHVEHVELGDDHVLVATGASKEDGAHHRGGASFIEQRSWRGVTMRRSRAYRMVRNPATGPKGTRLKLPTHPFGADASPHRVRIEPPDRHEPRAHPGVSQLEAGLELLGDRLQAVAHSSGLVASTSVRLSASTSRWSKRPAEAVMVSTSGLRSVSRTTIRSRLATSDERRAQVPHRRLRIEPCSREETRF